MKSILILILLLAITSYESQVVLLEKESTILISNSEISENQDPLEAQPINIHEKKEEKIEDKEEKKITKERKEVEKVNKSTDPFLIEKNLSIKQVELGQNVSNIGMSSQIQIKGKYTDNPNSFFIWLFLYSLFFSSVAYISVLIYDKKKKYEFINCDLNKEMHYQLLKEN